MIRIYFIYILLLLNNILFANQQISILKKDLLNSEPRTATPLSEKCPDKSFTQLNYWKVNEKYRELINIAKYLHNQINEVEVASDEVKSFFGSPSNYIIFKCKEKTSLTPTKYYSFEWKKKKYSSLKKNGIESVLVKNYEHLPAKDLEVEFLYSYKKPNTDPWAIKIHNKIHVTMWVKAEIKPVKNHQDADPFLVPHSELNEQEKNNVQVLVNEDDQIIAKRFNNGPPIFR